MSNRPKRTSKKPLIMDTGPLVLMLVGTYDETLIGRAKRIKGYRLVDFHALLHYIKGRTLVITPGVLAETTNLLGQIKHPGLSELVEHNLQVLRELKEHIVPKVVIIELPTFSSMGYSDTSLIITVAEIEGEVITADHALHSRCRNLGHETIHMDYLAALADQFV